MQKPRPPPPPSPAPCPMRCPRAPCTPTPTWSSTSTTQRPPSCPRSCAPVVGADEPAAPYPEIGRASCRERVERAVAGGGVEEQRQNSRRRRARTKQRE